jgi:hypothetical protein
MTNLLEQVLAVSPPDYYTLAERFWGRVYKSEDAEGCWEWTGAVDRRERGLFYPYSSRKGCGCVDTARMSLILAGTEPGYRIPVRILCKNSRCVRPDHLHVGPFPLAERFWPKVNISNDPNGCWEWLAGKFSDGYGTFAVRVEDGSMVSERAHRVSFEMHYGPIPDGMQVLHDCDNRPCVRPDHIYAGTHEDNMRDRDKRNRTSRGEQIGTSRLTELDVRQMRNRRIHGDSYDELAIRFGVVPAYVRAVCAGRSWKHLQ